MRSWYRGRQRWGEGRKGGLLEEGPRKINKGRSIGLGKKKKKEHFFIQRTKEGREYNRDAEEEHKEIFSAFCYDIGKAASYQGNKTGLEALRTV